ncbi:MAG: tetratricopeptide repeat protein [Planctomycetes bacterium]|nr:tetratricopeptide repeat protein [Planctomycetota bacterium]
MQPEGNLDVHSQPVADRWGVGLCGLLVVAGVAVYANGFQGVFLFDDLQEIVQEPRIRRLWPLLELLAGRRPVVDLTLAVNYALGGLHEWGFHAVNLAVHILASITLFGLVRRTLSRLATHARVRSSAEHLAFTIALFWLIHPLQTQSVTYLIQRSEALMGLFYLLTLYSVLRGSDSARSTLWYVLAVFACALGMGSKAVMVTAPVMVLLLDRTILAGSFRAALRQRWGLYVGLASTWMILIVCGVAGTVLNPSKTHVTVGLGFQGATPWEYALTQPGVLLHYMKVSLWPNSLCLDYGWPVAGGAREIVAPALVLAFMLAGTFRALIRKSWLGLVGAWFFVILSPTSSIIPIQDAAFEHRMYLPLAAVITAAVVGVWWVVATWSARHSMSSAVVRAIHVSLIAGAAIPLAYLTVDRNRDYGSAVTMWRDVVAKRPANPRGYYNLGKALDEAGHDTEAMRHYQRATEVDPMYDEAYFGQGVLLSRQGRLGDAVKAYREAIRLRPGNADARSNLGNVLVRLGRFDQAVEQYDEALLIMPGHADARYNLGSTWLQLGRFPDAIRVFREVLQRQPDHMPARRNLGAAFADSGRWDEAIQAYREALRLDPTHANTHANLGIALLQWGRFEEARKSLRRALEIEPDHAAARRALRATPP